MLDQAPVLPRFQRDGFIIDPDWQIATWNGKPIAMTPTRLLVLYAIARGNGRVVTRDTIIQFLDRDIIDQNVTQQLSRLRAVLAYIGAPIPWKAAYGYGYRWTM